VGLPLVARLLRSANIVHPAIGPFFAHIDADGHASKPFELPMQDPDRHRQLLKSYNVPELMRGPVKLTPQQIADVLKGL